MEIIRILFPVVLGGIIGAFTNYLAIKMMFRPYTEKRIFGFVVPFTPGIIPKRQNDLARAIGRVVGEKLVDVDGISKMLLSEDTISKIKAKVDSLVRSLQENDETLMAFFSKYAGEERIDALKKRVVGNLENKIDGIVSDDTIGQRIASSAVLALDEKAGNGFWGKMMNNIVADSLKEKMTPKLADLINDVMRGDGKRMILSIVNDEVERFSNGTVSSWAASVSNEKLETIKQYVVEIYTEKVKSELPRILQTVDIRKVVEEKIQNMDMPMVESLVLDVANTELKMLVVLGGLLGAIIGLANIFIMI